MHWELTGQTTFGVYYLDSRETLRPQDLPGLRSIVTFPTSQWGIMFSSSRIPELTVSGSFASGRGINLVPAAGEAPTSERSKTANLSIVLRPVTSLTVDNTYLLTRLDGVFDNHILRTKWSYQLNRALSVRAIVHYDAVQANDGRTSLASSKNVNVDLLVKYHSNYGTALYVGYNSNRRSFDPSVHPVVTGVHRRAGALVNDSSQFFVKLSYLLRFDV